MGAIPGGVETDRQPPMTIPLRHFVAGLAFLLAGALLGLGTLAGVVSGGSLAHIHLLLAGWVCVTIMGAMTQFVPVWSGVELYSRRLARAQLPLVAVGLSGFAVALLLDALPWLIPFGALMALGFWVFVYNVLRTMAPLGGYDVTERHFLYSLGFFLLLTTLGLALAVDFTRPVFAPLPVDRAAVASAHATLAVFGAVLTAVYGALYQLGTMFTQTELHGADVALRYVEEASHLAGVTLLAAGRLGGVTPVARAGAGLTLVAALSVSAVLGRKLYEMRVDRSPMHTRYGVAAPALALWALLTAPAWLADPTARGHLFGPAGAAHLLALGAVGFVVLGTLYHVVPFIVWVHRYSDRLGFEEVPTVDDLYDGRLAAADAALLTAGLVALVASEWVGLPALARGAGGALIALGAAAFAANMLLVVRNHSPHSLVGLFS